MLNKHIFNELIFYFQFIKIFFLARSFVLQKEIILFYCIFIYTVCSLYSFFLICCSIVQFLSPIPRHLTCSFANSLLFFRLLFFPSPFNFLSLVSLFPFPPYPSCLPLSRYACIRSTPIHLTLFYTFLKLGRIYFLVFFILFFLFYSPSFSFSGLS